MPDDGAASLMSDWRALVDGDVRARTVRVVRDVCDEAAARWIGSPLPGLLGHAAYAVMFHYVTEAGLGDYRAQATDCVDRACASLGEVALGPSLHTGVTGIAWVVQHLSSALAVEADAVDDIDALLDDYVARDRSSDGAETLCNIAVYALERMPRPAARTLLERVVARLDRIAVREAGGVAWRSRAAGKTVISLGAAHGVPGILAVLAGAAAWGIAGARELVERGAAWLWTQRDPAAAIQLAYWRDDGGRPNRQWPAWCTGDPGVAGAMLAAARAIGSPPDEAIELARHALAWTPARFGAMTADQLLALFGEHELVSAWTDNPFLCHGTAGRLHLANRMYQATGDDRFARAAADWLDATLALRRPGAPFGGFSHGVDRDDGSLIYGATGLVLALTAAATSVEPRWDRLLMLSLATPGEGRAQQDSNLRLQD